MVDGWGLTTAVSVGSKSPTKFKLELRFIQYMCSGSIYLLHVKLRGFFFFKFYILWLDENTYYQRTGKSFHLILINICTYPAKNEYCEPGIGNFNNKIIRNDHINLNYG